MGLVTGRLIAGSNGDCPGMDTGIETDAMLEAIK